MREKIVLRSPELLHIRDGGRLYLGADQEWYRDLWQRQAGCGPTNTAQLLWYLAQTRPHCRALAGRDCGSKEGFLALMEEVWHYVTPGKMGVNSTAILTKGALRYGEERGVPLNCRVLEIAVKPFARPAAAELMEFIGAALADDLPLAFLNLAKGAVANLDSWHWVTLVALDKTDMTATMYNQGEEAVINMGLWLKTSALGGGLVALEPARPEIF
jgi:hypothetical protein